MTIRVGKRPTIEQRRHDLVEALENHGDRIGSRRGQAGAHDFGIARAIRPFIHA
jgi:hypothetical protein